MHGPKAASLSQLPSVDRLVQHPGCAELIRAHGAVFVTQQARTLLAQFRRQLLDGVATSESVQDAALVQALKESCEARLAPRMKRVINLTGTKEASDTSPVAAPDNRTIAYSVRLEKAPATNLAVLDLATRKARVLTHEKDPTRMWTAVAFSADSRTLIANRHDILQSHGEIYRVDVATGKATLVTVKEIGRAHV